MVFGPVQRGLPKGAHDSFKVCTVALHSGSVALHDDTVPVKTLESFARGDLGLPVHEWKA